MYPQVQCTPLSLLCSPHPVVLVMNDTKWAIICYQPFFFLHFFVIFRVESFFNSWRSWVAWHMSKFAILSKNCDWGYCNSQIIVHSAMDFSSIDALSCEILAQVSLLVSWVEEGAIWFYFVSKSGCHCLTLIIESTKCQSKQSTRVQRCVSIYETSNIPVFSYNMITEIV